MNVIVLPVSKIISLELYECTYLQNTGLHKFNLIPEDSRKLVSTIQVYLNSRNMQLLVEVEVVWWGFVGGSVCLL